MGKSQRIRPSRAVHLATATIEQLAYWKDRPLHIAGAGSFGARAADKREAIPRLYNVLEIERDFSAIKVHTRRQLTPDGNWDGWAEWDDPKGGKGRFPYYDLKI